MNCESSVPYDERYRIDGCHRGIGVMNDGIDELTDRATSSAHRVVDIEIVFD